MEHGMEKREGYRHGISPGMELYHMCRELEIGEMSFYGFTADNTKRPVAQRQAFTRACVAAVDELSREDASLLVIGNTASPMFPKELLPLYFPPGFWKGGYEDQFSGKLQLGVGYGDEKGGYGPRLKSQEISRMDLVIRWGGRRRLSGFLPVQSVYSDIYVVEDYWPDFKRKHVEEALKWYSVQDVTLGG